jgi:hypothetical protein
MEIITNRLYHAKERISGIGDKAEKLLHKITAKKQKKEGDHNCN